MNADSDLHNPYILTSEVPAEPTVRPGRTKWFGIAAITLGFAGTLCSVMAYHFFEEPEARSQSTLTIDLGIVKWERESATPPPEPGIRELVTPFHMRMTAVSLGAIAVALSIVSWYRKEGFWLGFGGCVFAAAAVAWIWFIVVFALLLMSGALFAVFPTERLQKQASSE